MNPNSKTNLLVRCLASLCLLPTGQACAAPLSAFMGSDDAPKLVAYKTTEGTPQQLAVFYPPGWTAADKRPAIVFIHGGAWVAGDRLSFYPQARYFAARGAVTMSVDYRLEQAFGSSLENCVADCRSALRYVRGHAAEFGIDPNRIGAFGDSAGGHLAAALATCPGFDDPRDDLKISPVPNAVVLCNPIVDLTAAAWIKHVVRGDALQKKPKPEEVHPTEDQLKLARALSPLSNVRPGQVPALLMHGTKDTVVDPAQARDYADACHRAGNRCDLEWIQDARHAFVAVGYTAAEPVTVGAIRRADQFFGTLGWLAGEPTLEVSHPPAWEPRK